MNEKNAEPPPLRPSLLIDNKLSKHGGPGRSSELPRALSADLAKLVGQRLPGGVEKIDLARRQASDMATLLMLAPFPPLVADQIKRIFEEELTMLTSAKPTPEAKKSKSLTFSQMLFPELEPGEQYEEVDRTLMGMICLLWVIMKDYDLLREFNENAWEENELPENIRAVLRMKDSDCDTLREYVIDGIADDFKNLGSVLSLAVGIDLQMSALMNHDKGKVESLADRVCERLQQEGKPIPANHDLIFRYALEYFPEEFPSISSDPERLETIKKMLAGDWNPLQRNQLEDRAGSITPELRNMELHIFKLKCVESLADLLGAKGSEIQNGSPLFIKPLLENLLHTFKITEELIANEEDPIENFNRKVQYFADIFSDETYTFDIARPTDRAVVILGANARLTNPSQARRLLQTYTAQKSEIRSTLDDEINRHGIDDIATMIEYAPALAVNGVGYYKAQGNSDDIETAFSHILPLYARMFREVRATYESDTNIPNRVATANIEAISNFEDDGIDPATFSDLEINIETLEGGDTVLSFKH